MKIYSTRTNYPFNAYKFIQQLFTNCNAHSKLCSTWCNAKIYASHVTELLPNGTRGGCDIWSVNL